MKKKHTNVVELRMRSRVRLSKNAKVEQTVEALVKELHAYEIDVPFPVAVRMAAKLDKLYSSGREDERAEILELVMDRGEQRQKAPKLTIRVKRTRT